MTTDTPTEPDAVAEVPTSSPEPPIAGQHRSGRRGRGEVVMTFAVPEPVRLHCGGSALRGPLPEPEGHSA